MQVFSHFEFDFHLASNIPPDTHVENYFEIENYFWHNCLKIT